MSRSFSRRPLGLLLLMCWCAAAAGQDGATTSDGLARARSAASAGDAASAIALYDGLLQASPDDPVLLAESAQQLSWAGRYDEALERYARVLVLRPRDRFAQLERAKVLSWSARYREAAEAFRALLAADETDAEARLGLARSLSWSGDQAAAREEFGSVLAAHPGHPEALLGLARTYAWSGRSGEARQFYAEAARAATDPKDAEIGLAYLDLWEGQAGRAAGAARRLAASHPGDKEVEELRRAIRRATGPWFAAGWEQMDDSDRNLLTVSRFEAHAASAGGARFGLAYARHDVQTAGTRGSIDSLQARGEWLPLRGHRLEAMVGVDRLARPGLAGKSVTDWGLAYGFPLGEAWQGSIGARREPYRYSVPLIDNRIVIDSVTAAVSGNLGDRWLLGAQLDAWDVSDGNNRLAGNTYLRRRWHPGPHTLEAGAALRWLDWRKDLDGGYFDPSGFTAVGATLRAYGPLPGQPRFDYGLSIEAGTQSFDFGAQRTRGDPYYVASAQLGWLASDGVRVELFAEAGSYASEGSEDWRYGRGGARVTWRPRGGTP